MSDVDTGTLGWVKAEIDRTIAEARACLSTDFTGDDTPLRMLANHVHQLVGTLQMADLGGPAIFATEAEALVDHVRRAEVGSSAVSLLDELLGTLSDYLSALEGGAPDIPLRHLELLNRMRAARGADPFDPAALFTPDLTVDPAGHRVTRELPDTEYQSEVRQLRRAYQSRLLGVLNASVEPIALNGLADIVDQLLELARFKSVAQLWWVAGAYFDWLKQEATELDAEAKQVLSRIDEQICDLGEQGESALVRDPPEWLLKMMLYRLATASNSLPRVAEIRDAFDLERLLGGEGEFDSEVLSRDALSTLPDEFVQAVTTAQRHLARYFESEHASNDLQRLRTGLETMYGHADAARAEPLTGLIGETQTVVSAIQKGAPIDLEQASLDIAASLLFIDKTLHSERRLDAEWADQLEARVNRLRALTTGSGRVGEVVDAHCIDTHEFREILTIVAHELKSDLGQAKTALEALAAHPESLSPCADASRAATQARGVLQMLEHDRVARLADLVHRRFEALGASQSIASPAIIDALAVALTAIEGYLDGLADRPVQSDTRIDLAMQDLVATAADDEPAASVQYADRTASDRPSVSADQQPEAVSSRADVVAIFVGEFTEHLSILRQAIDCCKRSAADCQVSGELKRALHTVVGSARALNFNDLGEAYHVSAHALGAVQQRGEPLRSTQLAILDRLAELSSRVIRELKSKHTLSPPVLESLRQLVESVEAGTRAHPESPVTRTPAAENADFLSIFIDEAMDILARVEEGLHQWRSGQEPGAVLAELRRELHTLKGSARAVGVEVIGELSHSTETLLDQIVGDATEFEEPMLLELLEEVHDGLLSAVGQLRKGEPPALASGLNTRLKRFPDRTDGGVLDSLSVPPPAVTHMENDSSPVADAPLPRSQVRVSPALLDRLVNYAGEISIMRARVQEQFKTLKLHLQDLRGHLGRFRDQLRELELHAEDQIRVHREDQEPTARVKDFDPLEFDRYTKLQQLSRNLVESLDAMVTVNTGMNRVAHDSESVLQEQGHLSSELHGSLLRARMVPFGTVVPRLRHQLRHTAREVSKQAELQIVGEDVGVDRTILESMTEAFEHMIRNAVGHGIETPEQRVAARKPPMGCIRIECTLEGSEVRLQFSDDGRGLNVDDIRTRALSRGLIDQGALLSDQELLQLIVAPGFSTIDSVTELSGRGVGMDVVHSAVRRLGGTISVQSRVHEGTTFSMRLPVSLAMTQAVFVRCGNHTFAVSLRAVETISEVPLNSLSNDETTGEPLLAHQNHRYPLMNLTERFGLLSMAPKHDNVPILLARMGATHVAVQVDELVGTQEIVVKKVGAHLGGLEGIAGAAVRGDGRPVLVLDVVDLWVSEEATNGKLRLTDDDHADQSPLVMVVDDSLTVRKVTSRNLTRHGMRVAMAKDGVNALDQVKSQLPDIMLIDVEMPRMDGYELTARIRAHPATRAIPIIMVTSRAGEKHRHRALELGADAYITKPYHEDELVVEVRRLLGARKKVGSDNDKTVIH